MTTTMLAEELRVPLNMLALHLSSLVTAGLVVLRKSGAWCDYRSDSPYNETAPSGKLTVWLKSLFGGVQSASENPGLHEVRDFFRARN
jgi:hypothetical protein